MKKILSVISVIVFVLCMGNTGFAMETELTQDINVYDDDEMIDDDQTSLKQTVSNASDAPNGENNIDYDSGVIDMSDAIEIRTPRDLYNIRNNLGGKYKLMNDIDLNEVTAPDGIYDFQGQGWKPIGCDNDYASTPFTGVLDGQGYCISGLNINVNLYNKNTPSYLGLISSNEGEIRNLKIDSFIINSSGSHYPIYCGCLVGQNSGKIQDIQVYNSTINCSAYGRMANSENKGYVGGICGISQDFIAQSYAEVSFDIKCSGHFRYSSPSEKGMVYIYASGISSIGSENAKISSCYSNCSYKKEEYNPTSNGVYAGTAFIYTAGIGYCQNGLIENCFSVSNKCDYGITNAGTIKNCYYIGTGKPQTSGTATNCYYMINKGTAGTGWIALNDLQMKEASFFEGFDFDDVWYMSEDTVYKYPQLQSVKNGVTKVEIVSEPTNEIVVGTELKYEGAVARIFRDNGSTEDVVLTPENTTGGDTSTVGKKTVTYTYKGASASFDIDVVAVAPKELEIASLPTKTTYGEGEAFEPTGLTVNVVYNNGEVAACTDYTIGDVDNSHGTKTVEISYMDMTATFEVTYNKKDIASLEVVEQPDKNEYNEGEEFDPAGMVVKAVFTDGTSKNITDYTVGQITGTGNVNLEVSRDGVSTTVQIKVNHILTEVQAKAATCTAAGNDAYYKCSVCNKYFSDDKGVNEIQENSWVRQATGHTPNDAVRENEVAATCEIPSSYDEVIYCKTCGHKISSVKHTGEANGHTPKAAVRENEEEATCEEDGSYDEVIYCQVCNKEISRVTHTIEAPGHTPKAAVKENEVTVTCETDGTYDEVVYCEICGKELSRNNIISEIKGHKWSSWKVTTAATYSKEGVETRTCSRCNKKETRKIDKLKPENPKPPVSGGTILSLSIDCQNTSQVIVAKMIAQKSSSKDAVEYRWLAYKDGDGWKEISPWTRNNEWLSWVPDKYGDYVIVGQARIVGNEAASQVEASYGVSYHKHIKGICQMPYTGEGGGFLIGIESYDNPGNSYKYEMLILDCNLYLQGKDAWVYTTGKCGAEESCLWTIWQPQYGYYWTLFRIYDENDNLIDEACYGFENVN